MPYSSHYVNSSCTFSAGTLDAVDIKDQIGLLLAEADRAGADPRHAKALPPCSFIWDCDISNFAALIDVSYGEGPGGSNSSTPNVIALGDWRQGDSSLNDDIFSFNGGGATSAQFKADALQNENAARVTTDAIIAVMGVPVSTYCPQNNIRYYLGGDTAANQVASSSIGDPAYRLRASSNDWLADFSGNPEGFGTTGADTLELAGHTNRDAGAAGLQDPNNQVVEFKVVCGSKLAVQALRTDTQMTQLPGYQYAFGPSIGKRTNSTGSEEDDKVHYKYSIEALLVEKFDNLLAQDFVQLMARQQLGTQPHDGSGSWAVNDGATEIAAAQNQAGWNTGAGVDELSDSVSQVVYSGAAGYGYSMDWQANPSFTDITITNKEISDMIHANMDASGTFGGEKVDSIEELRAIIKEKYRDLNMWGCVSSQLQNLALPMKVHSEAISVGDAANVAQLQIKPSSSDTSTQPGSRWEMNCVLAFVDP